MAENIMKITNLSSSYGNIKALKKQSDPTLIHVLIEIEATILHLSTLYASPEITSEKKSEFEKMIKVVKFGGSSLASAEQFAKVGKIIQADKERRYVVPSAPGKRNAKDTKVTDMLYACYALVRGASGGDGVPGGV